MSADFSRADCLTTIGVMSGTSLDGADAVAVRFERSTVRALRMTRLGHAFLPMPDALRSELLSLALGRGADEIERMGTASVALANLYAEVVEKLLSENGIDRGTIAAIGVHGQTIRHRPEKGFTLQLNHPALVAERCGIDVVADFRSRDVAAGGEGAPLVPAFHAQAFAGDEPTAVLNIGGIANVTILPPAAHIAEGRAAVLGFDTGPGNMLLDAFMQTRFGQACDRDGALARTGHTIDALLERCLKAPYFALAAPKSTGRELFGIDWLEAQLEGFAECAPADIAATITRLTARSAAEALARYAPETKRFIVAGGGSLNPTLMAMLEEELKCRTAVECVADTRICGIDPMEVEGAAFAWLAQAFLAREPGNLPAVTRAAGPRILGALYPARCTP